MQVEVGPDTLEFRRPFNQVVRQTIVLTNTGSEAAAFKIKTTAPKQYCVRPNAGLVAGGATREIEVLLQAMREDPPADAKCKDKFLVQTLTAPKGLTDSEADAAALAALWARADAAKKSGQNNDALPISICEKKLKCVFLPPSFVVGAIPPAVPPAIPVPQTPSGPASTAASTADRELRDAKDAIKRLTLACEGYKAEIERLNVLRQRRAAEDAKAATAAGSASHMAQLNAAKGLPFPLVIVLALIAFLLGAAIF